MGRSSNNSRRARLLVTTWKPQCTPLYALTDQGAPKLLDLSDFAFGKRDRSWNNQAQNFIAANRPQLTALSVEAQLIADSDIIGLALRPGGVVGAVPLHAPDTRKIMGGVLVRPRFGWNGIGPLLDSVGWSAQPQILDFPLVPGSAREVPPWVLAGPVLNHLAALVKDLRRGFQTQEDIRQTPRGKILWQRYVGSQMTRGAYQRLPCRFPDLCVDLELRGYIRWGIEAVRRSLAPYSLVDVVARRLSDHAQELLFELKDAPARPPNRQMLDSLLHGTGPVSNKLALGLQALGWVVDERGLGGRSETDGLAWALPMHELFERWVEHVVRSWAWGFGGAVRTAHGQQTLLPIEWRRPGHGSLTSLIPDIVVRCADHVYVIDAKYKGHFQELDDTRWLALAEELREQHRHDIHQVLAYTSLFEAKTITAVLVYPMHPGTWQKLTATGRTVTTASIAAGGRAISLALVGVPITSMGANDVALIARTLDALLPLEH